MSLRDVMNEVLEKFDPKTDDPNAGGFDNLPDGEYDIVLSKVEHKVFQSGWECLSFEHEVVSGEFSGRKEFVNFGFGDSTPEFVLKKNIKLVAKAASVTGISLTDDDWEDETTLAAAFEAAVGSQYILKITSSPNKKTQLSLTVILILSNMIIRKKQRQVILSIYRMRTCHFKDVTLNDCHLLAI